MKNMLLAIVVLFISVSTLGFSQVSSEQKSLPESRRSSAELIVYKLDGKDVRNLYLKGKKLDESMLHTLVMRCADASDIPVLPRGNYIQVRVVGNELQYSDHTVDNFYHNIVEDEKVMLLLSDTLGNVINDAIVKQGLKRLKFDENTRTYNTRRIGDEKIVEINNNGVFHFIEFEKGYRYHYRSNFFTKGWFRIRNGFNRVFDPDMAYIPDKYDGFVVFSKPKYKPGETVRLKAYINHKGKPYNKVAEVSLRSNYPEKIDTTLTTLQPYRPGMYEWEFTLSDSLKLHLDNSYYLVLKTRGWQSNDISGQFRLEEYELGRITFEAKADKERYVKGDTVKLQFDARDENNMPVYDGRVDITVRPSSRSERKYYANNLFIPNEIWSHSFDLNGKASEELVLPDSIFIPGTGIYYDVECSFFDSSNEKHTMTKPLYMDMHDWMDDSSEEKKELAYRFFREKGNIRLVVDNPSGFPFWYTIRKGKKIIDKGYETALDYSYKDKGKNGYTMQLSYLLDEKARTITGNLPYVEKNLSMEVNTPTTVYPGQTAKVDLLVRDKKGKPVKNADITAYAFTSKFGMRTPPVTVYGKTVSGKGFKNKEYDLSDAAPYNATTPMEWSIWKERMGLDSIAYYQFLYPEISYSYAEKAPGKVTQIAPYVVIGGKPQGVHIIWIDEQPHYFYQARQLNVYSFPVKPGYHTLRFRTYDREITAENVYVEEGMKTILSVNGETSMQSQSSSDKADHRPLQIAVRKYKRKEQGELSESEMAQLKEHMITIDNTAGTANFPNDESIYTPMILNAGGTYYWLNDAVARRYDYRARSYVTDPILSGPFPDKVVSTGGENSATLYVDTMFINTFDIIGGHRYGVWKNRVIQTEWGKEPFHSSVNWFTPQLSFSQHALTPESIREMFYARLLDRVQRKRGLMISGKTGKESIGSGVTDTGVSPVAKVKIESPWDMSEPKDGDGFHFRLDVGYLAGKKVTVSPLMIRLSPSEKNSTPYIYYGGTRNFTQLPAGSYQVDLIFKDSTRYAVQVTLRENGFNYLKMDSIRPIPADSIAISTFDLLYSHLYISKPGTLDDALFDDEGKLLTTKADMVSSFSSDNYAGEVITGIIRDREGEPLIGATVSMKGTTNGTVTDINGFFRLPAPISGDMVVHYIGFQPFMTSIIPGHDYQITLEENYETLDEVVVTGYGGGREKGGLLGLLDISMDADSQDTNILSEELAGAAAGILIRGTSSVAETPPLIIINGIPYDGALSDFDAANIASMNMVKDADIAIYGARAANGVIFIETKDGVSPTVSATENLLPEGWDSANSLRTNFHDDAFWKPRLSTGNDGTVSFEVTYPDDITSWNANFIAVGGKRQTDKAQLNIKSFKPLNAQLSTPQFAILGDSMNVIGRLTNHLGDTVRIQRSIEWQGNSSKAPLTLLNAYVDTIPMVANEPDSMHVTYSMSMESGYFDGERRSIPVFQPGVLESHGEFAVLGDTAVRRFLTDPALGKVTVHAQSSALQSFLEEIEKIDRYPYFCNEQVASKIKALLLKKHILPMFGMEFKEEGKIGRLIRRLERNRNSDDLWGWWNQDKTELWISKQIVEALLDAESDGYKVNFNKRVASDALVRELNRRLTMAKSINDDPFIKHQLLNVLELLRKLDAKIDYPHYFRIISSLPDSGIHDKLRSMQIALMLDSIDIKDRPRVDSILHLSSETMLGSIHWGEKEEKVYPWHFMLPDINTVENTLVAYHILREVGGQDEELRKIRNYFFEVRKNGFWQNTYESSRIMETIMPDMIAPESIFSDVKLAVNGSQYQEFPFTAELEAGETVEVRKTGTLPIFFTVYQQAWNNVPERVSEGLSVTTAFIDHKDNAITLLEAGKSVDLQVSVTTQADADYVMIEVPIPAGCSYESKDRGDFRKETHREYHKEKVVIFCLKLSGGSHDFTIKLNPRYTGHYHLNPAKAELMYFPTFFGRGETGKCEIK